jgi:hypothetical protein
MSTFTRGPLREKATRLDHIERPQVLAPWTPAFALRYPKYKGRHNFLSAPGGGEGRVRWGIPERLATTHLTLPSLHDGPLPLPPEAGGEGQIPQRVDAAPEIV